MSDEPRPLFDPATVERRTCPYCRGSGYTRGQADPCDFCHGEGTLPPATDPQTAPWPEGY